MAIVDDVEIDQVLCNEYEIEAKDMNDKVTYFEVDVAYQSKVLLPTPTFQCIDYQSKVRLTTPLFEVDVYQSKVLLPTPSFQDIDYQSKVLLPTWTFQEIDFVILEKFNGSIELVDVSLSSLLPQMKKQKEIQIQNVYSMSRMHSKKPGFYDLCDATLSEVC